MASSDPEVIGQDVQLVKPIDTLSFPVPGDAECASLKVMWNSY